MVIEQEHLTEEQKKAREKAAARLQLDRERQPFVNAVVKEYFTVTNTGGYKLKRGVRQDEIFSAAVDGSNINLNYEIYALDLIRLVDKMRSLGYQLPHTQQ